MEHAQRVGFMTRDEARAKGLNPYFNGTCSKREFRDYTNEDTDYVLILILMEHAQRGG